MLTYASQNGAHNTASHRRSLRTLTILADSQVAIHAYAHQYVRLLSVSTLADCNVFRLHVHVCMFACTNTDNNNRKYGIRMY
jgi:hypothetical protein